MGNAWMGAMTDIMHDVWTSCMDNAQRGAMTDKPNDVQMEGMYNVWTDATGYK